MHAKWQLECSKAEYKHLERLHDDIKRTQNVVSGSQEDAAQKMCKLSLLADRELRQGFSGEKFLKAYNDLAKASDFTPKNAKNVGDFDSCGELFKWLEKRGWDREFYDFNNKDDVDLTMGNVQEYLRRLVMGEASLAEEVEKAQMAMKSMEINSVDVDAFSIDRMEAEVNAAIDSDGDDDEEFLLNDR